MGTETLLLVQKNSLFESLTGIAFWRVVRNKEDQPSTGLSGACTEMISRMPETDGLFCFSFVSEKRLTAGEREREKRLTERPRERIADSYYYL